MYFSLVVIPDSASGFGENSLDRQQKAHLLRLKDSALWIDERDAFAIEDEARFKVGRRQMIVYLAQPSNVLESRHSHERVPIRFIHASRHLDRP